MAYRQTLIDYRRDIAKALNFMKYQQNKKHSFIN